MPRARFRVLRLIAAAAALGVAGLLCTVLAAWVCSQHGSRLGRWAPAEILIEGDRLVGERQTAPGRRRLTSWPIGLRVPAGALALRSDSPIPVRTVEALPPFEPRHLWGEPGDAVVSQFASGWPLPALAWTQTDERSGPTRVATGIWLPAWTLLGGPAPLPLQPIWPALLLDAVAWGAALGMAGFAINRGPRFVRRAWRRRRGRCVCCGYDLAATPGACPECGQNRARP